MSRRPGGRDNRDPVLFYIHRLSRSIMRASMAQYMRLFGLGVPQMQILAQLGENANLSSKDIAGATAMHKALISRSLSELTRLGYTRIATDADDARKSLWRLTRKGEELVAAFQPIRIDRRDRLLKVLSPREQTMLISFIGRLYHSSEELGREEARAARRKDSSRPARTAKRADAVKVVAVKAVTVKATVKPAAGKAPERKRAAVTARPKRRGATLRRGTPAANRNAEMTP